MPFPLTEIIDLLISSVAIVWQDSNIKQCVAQRHFQNVIIISVAFWKAVVMSYSV